MRTPNSSPPKRATTSPGRRWARRRGATARSRASPAWWPRLSLISLKWSRSRKRIPIGEPEAVARFSESLRASTKLSRFGRPVRESWRTRWRSAWSAAWRSIASASTLARPGRRERPWGRSGAARSAWMSSTPNGWSLPSIITARLLAAPTTRSTGGIVKRLSLVQSVTIVWVPDSSAAPAWESSAAETRRPAPTTSSSRPARRLRRRPSRPSSQMQALWTPSTSPISEIAARISDSGSPSCRARSPSLATTACWASARCSSASVRLRSVMS